MRRNKRTAGDDINPDITPLIDVVFILLIFFMTTSVFKKEEAELMLKLPQATDAKSKDDSALKSLLIELGPEDLHVNGKVSDLKSLDQLASMVTDKSLPIELRIDKSIQYEKIVNILNLLHKYNLANLSLVTRQ